MDILRKELNSIYEAQHLDREELCSSYLADIKNKADMMVRMNGACAVVTDASCNRCYIYTGGFGRMMGFTAEPCRYWEVNSSDEDEIYSRLHPEDLVEKRMLEYEFFRMVDSLPAEAKTSYRATCLIRIRDRQGTYRLVENTTQVAGLSPSGKIWLILCCYDLSPARHETGSIFPNIINNSTGEIITMSLGEKRQDILTQREKEILRLIRDGMASKQIAGLLEISIHTVNRHRQNIIEKLSVGNSVEAVTAATAMKLL